MISLDIFHPLMQRLLKQYYDECRGLSDEEFEKQFQKTFRGAIVLTDGVYKCEFTDENYTWFVLKWG